MSYEWDEAKNRRNQRKHGGISFELAARVFEDSHCLIGPDRVDKDSEINFQDIPQLTDEQLAKLVRLRDVKRKVAVSVRLDAQVLDWLKSKGRGRLTRINDILTNLMEAERRSR